METPDHVPTFYQHLGGAKSILGPSGLTMRGGYEDPEVFAKICIKSHEVTGYDNVMAGWGDLLIEAQALESTLKFPEL